MSDSKDVKHNAKDETNDHSNSNHDFLELAPLIQLFSGEVIQSDPNAGLAKFQCNIFFNHILSQVKLQCQIELEILGLGHIVTCQVDLLTKSQGYIFRLRIGFKA